LGWFDLSRMRASSVLLVGAGALGNEASKNLVLSGVGRLTIVDPDRVTRSNLHRCALFLENDAIAARPKAEALADALSRLDPEVRPRALVATVDTLPSYGRGGPAVPPGTKPDVPPRQGDGPCAW
jgi:molybdopterin/thiamine biosynthesis adenylyltransferase